MKLSPPRRCDILDRLENLDISTAAADIAIEVAPNVFSGGLGMCLQERCAGQQHPRSAEATLGRAAVDEGFLEGIQVASRRQTFDRRHTLARRLEGQVRAGADGLTVHQYSAGPTDLRLARAFRPGEVEPLAHELYEGFFRTDVATPRL